MESASHEVTRQGSIAACGKLLPPLQAAWELPRPGASKTEKPLFGFDSVFLTTRKEAIWQIRDGEIRELAKPPGPVFEPVTFSHYLSFRTDQQQNVIDLLTGERLDIPEEGVLLGIRLGQQGHAIVEFSSGSYCLAARVYRERPVRFRSGVVDSGRFYGQWETNQGIRSGCMDLATASIVWEASGFRGIGWRHEQLAGGVFSPKPGAFVAHIIDIETGGIVAEIPLSWHRGKCIGGLLQADGKLYRLGGGHRVFTEAQLLLASPREIGGSWVAGGLSEERFWYVQRFGDRFSKVVHTVCCQDLDRNLESWRLELKGRRADLDCGFTERSFFVVGPRRVECFRGSECSDRHHSHDSEKPI